MYPELAQRVVVITGAGSGIGRACALRLAEEGCRLVLNDIDPDAADSTRALLPDDQEAIIVAGDTGQSETAAGLADKARQQWGSLDGWVNNAARSLFSPVAGTSDEDWAAVLQVTLNGAFYGVRSAVQMMRAHSEGGAIVNIASGAALGGEEGLGAYAAAKAALVNLTKTTAVENARAGIRCNVVLPGPIATPPMLAAAARAPGGVEGWAAQTVPGRLGQAEEIASAVCFLLSDQASYINGAALSVDGGVSARTNSPRF